MSQRLKYHLGLTAGTAASFGVAVLYGPADGAADRLSIVSAYLCLVLLGCALFIGPAHAITTGRPVFNKYVRRDIGIWAALVGLVHFFLANALAMNYAYLDLYVNLATEPPSPEFRSQLYGLGTISGYIVAVLFFLLLGLSSDRVLRWIGMRWWKRLQRASYLAFVLTVLHSFAFQALESREGFLVGVVSLVCIVILAVQVFGIAAVRKRSLTTPPP
jgi:DMSO/TMAO reductase YedYZ heme-binding membrane subunit